MSDCRIKTEKQFRENRKFSNKEVPSYTLKEDYKSLINDNLKFNLKIIFDKFLLFNFFKIFLKLKKKIFKYLNKVFFFNINSILTICLKKYSRNRFTAD